jgi:hypothetical protein
VTAFGGFIRGYSTLRDVRLADVERWASQAASGPGAEYRREFVDLVGRMRTLTTVPPQPARPDPEPEPEPDGCDPPFYVDPVTGIRKPKPFCMR